MRSARTWVALGSAGLAVSAATVAMAAPAATASSGTRPHPAVVHKTVTKASAAALLRSKPRGAVSTKSRMSFELVLHLRHETAERSFVRRVSTPGTKAYRHYLTDKQFQKRYGPSAAQVRHAKSWLTKHDFKVGAVPKDHLFVTGLGTVGQVERAFSTSFGRFSVNGHTVRLTTRNASVPSAISASVAGVAGLNEYLNTPDITTKGSTVTKVTAAPKDAEPAPPAGFRNAKPCAAYWGQKADVADSPELYAPYNAGRPYDICGYKPGQLQSAYGLTKQFSSGTTGKGVAVAIVDAYDSPTLLADAQEYYKINDPSHPLKSSQFVNEEPPTVDSEDECDASGWYAEQSLDVEAVHAMAPGATIAYFGGQNCIDGLTVALQNAVVSGASVVTNSWGDDVGDLLDDAADKAVFDNTFTLAATTGVSVLFSSGDDGDNFADEGLDAPDYPASSPFVTAVGGTSLQIGAAGTAIGNVGWSTAKETLCAGVATTSCGSSSTTGAPLAWQAGGGGGTSFTYTQPYYQAGVVPNAIATRNSAVFGPTPLRVIPDISMDADAQTGMLIGLTQTFPDGVYYDQFKEGGTSLASPLMAGVIADTDQVAGVSLGFINPDLYKAYKRSPGAIADILPPPVPHDSATIRVDYANTVDASNGYIVSLRVLDYEGAETYCDGTNNCATRKVTLTTKKGYDSLTGLGTVGAGFIGLLSNY
jgi:subtilase family serine protease